MVQIIKKGSPIYAMDKNNRPVATAKDGDRLVFEAYDCFEDQLTDAHDAFEKLDWNRINPATGPVYVEGAEVGDILAVTIEKLEIGDTATLFTGPDSGVMGDELIENTIRRLPIENGVVKFSENIDLPLNKMIGVIGTAPAGEAVSCGTPDAHGGNMDCKEIGEGTTLFLPVNVAGALLAMGDCHAAMGDGEVSVCGAEVPCDITVTIKVFKNKDWPTPFLLRDGKLSTIASAKTIDTANIMATKQMVHFVESYTELTKGEAIHLLSLAGNLRVCQIVDPNKTARMELPLAYLTKWSAEELN
ncbi:acetamidase/formamidase family protein [Listeria booriae]|uniref:acetamidase/formamidase family protein n=1 Tax=Listeria booriae TaxID=1552123 RepID=UPI001628C33B|nr:acetamidase/formamidase family protein [Listeria booriae]MBC2171015.1 acetamidase/formamidase family protein [Listeria booriae]MBC2174035.1 acetamidase/formamidase family protein [Listeria booriae]